MYTLEPNVFEDDATPIVNEDDPIPLIFETPMDDEDLFTDDSEEFMQQILGF